MSASLTREAAASPRSTPKPRNASTSTAETLGEGSVRPRPRRGVARGAPCGAPVAAAWPAAADPAARARARGDGRFADAAQQRDQLRTAQAGAGAAAQAVALGTRARGAAVPAAPVLVDTRRHPDPPIGGSGAGASSLHHGSGLVAGRGAAPVAVGAGRGRPRSPSAPSAPRRTASRRRRRGYAGPRTAGSSGVAVSSRRQQPLDLRQLGVALLQRAARRTSTSRRKWSRIAISYASPPRSQCSSVTCSASASRSRRSRRADRDCRSSSHQIPGRDHVGEVLGFLLVALAFFGRFFKTAGGAG